MLYVANFVDGCQAGKWLPIEAPDEYLYPPRRKMPSFKTKSQEPLGLFDISYLKRKTGGKSLTVITI